MKIICFGTRVGYQKRKSFDEEAETTTYQHYDLLIITKETAPITPCRFSQMIFEKTNQTIATTLIPASLGKVKKAIKKGNRFLIKVFAEGEEIYSAPGFSINLPLKPVTTEEFYGKAEIDWKVRTSRAASFFQAADSIAGDDEDTEVALMHRAVQQICLGILYLVWGFRPDNLNLHYLLQLCSNFSTAAEHSFPTHNAEDKRLYKKFLSAVQDSQFKTRQHRSLVDVDILLTKCRAFQNEMGKLAATKLQEYQTEIKNEDHEK